MSKYSDLRSWPLAFSWAFTLCPVRVPKWIILRLFFNPKATPLDQVRDMGLRLLLSSLAQSEAALIYCMYF